MNKHPKLILCCHGPASSLSILKTAESKAQITLMSWCDNKINIAFFTEWHGRFCHPEKTLSTESEQMWTMLFEGWWSTMSSRKECNIYFIVPIVPIPYTTSICYQITVCTWWHFQWMSPVAMTLLGKPRWPPFSIRTYISRIWHF